MLYSSSMPTQLSPSTTLWYIVQLGSVLGSSVSEAVVLVAVTVTEDAEVLVLVVVPIQTASPVLVGELCGEMFQEEHKVIQEGKRCTNQHQGMRSSSQQLDSSCRIR